VATEARETTYGGAPPQAVSPHYDLSNDFYATWLDESMTYSCALWDDGARDETLESAQRRKLDYLAAAARARGARGVLDVGCGWGSMLRHLTGECGVERAVGLTLSAEQAEHVAATAGAAVEVAVENWADHDPGARYGAIVSAGAFEHFARLGMTREEKTAAYRQFFERCHEWLEPGSGMALQTIAKGEVQLDAQGMRDVVFLARHIFPKSDIPRLSEIATAAEGLFEVETVRNDRRHYVRTCAAWLERLEANSARAEAIVGAEAVDVYREYMRASIRQFDAGMAALLRIGLRRIEPAGGSR
jgi:cyclopropane-fatty-acyl-phospholipid synthase